MWCRAVWREKTKEIEGVVPDLWITDQTVFWPNTADAKRFFEERKEPSKTWRKFPLIKVKISSGTYMF